MEMMGKIRRMYFRDQLSLHEITKRTGFVDLAQHQQKKGFRPPFLLFHYLHSVALTRS